MKKPTICFLLLITVLLVSCSRDNELDTSNIFEKDDSAPKTGEEAAMNAFNDFLERFNSKKVASRSEDSPKVINIRKTSTSAYKNKPMTRSQDESMPVYELTLQNTDFSEGFAIVVEDQTNHDVLAYVPNGSIADTTFNTGLSIWFDQLASITTNSSPSSSDPLIDDVWQDNWFYSVSAISEPQFYRNLEKDEITNNPNWWRSYYGPIDQATLYSAFVPSVWGQTSPYNNLVPQYYNNNGVIERCRIGCLAVAIGQLASYHRHPANYNWNLINMSPVITNNSPAANEVANLLYDIATLANTSYHPVSGAGQTGVGSNLPTISNLGYNVTQTYWGRSDGALAEAIFTEITESRPMIISAATADSRGHIWVIDGLYEFERWYYIIQRIMPTNSPSGYEVRRIRRRGRLAHCNWGWEGRSNGWYYDFIPQHNQNYHFDYSIIIYTGITPK